MKVLKSKKAKRRNKKSLKRHWSLLEPFDHVTLMLANMDFGPLHKEAARLKKEKLKGKLKQTDDDFVYIDINDSIIHGLFPLIDKDDNAKEPPYFGKGDDKIGAHISAISNEEITDDIKIDEIGKEIEFGLKEMYSTNPASWDEVNRVWFVAVDVPEIKKIRKKYNLPPTYLDKGHDFHITIGIREAKIDTQIKMAELMPTENERFVNLYKIHGFNKDGEPINLHQNKSKKEREKERKRWKEQEYEHMPA